MPGPGLQSITDANQARASDPGGSAWVSANAGTGKTTVLVRRVLRLLLHKDPHTGLFPRPESILCLTYTKAAAGEMENRLFKRLAGWTTLDDVALAEELVSQLGGPADAAQMTRARQLFAQTLDTQGGLKIYTIHAFCERLLHRFPLEAGVPSGFRVLEDVDRQQLLTDSTTSVLAQAGDRSDPLRSAVRAVIAETDQQTFREIIERMAGARGHVRTLAAFHRGRDSAAAEREALAALFGVPEGCDDAALIEQMGMVLGDADLDRLIDLLEGGAKTDLQTAEALREARAAPDPERRTDALRARFLTATGTPRRQLVTKAIAEANPEAVDRLTQAQTGFHKLLLQLTGLRVAEASASLLRLACEILDDYEQRKHTRAVLDYDDLIEKSGQLLTAAESAAWVLYKLDYGIAHVLVDEAQDTSPAQWRVIDALTSEFFTGETSRAAARTMFAVGDEKQSIYSFQGADPSEFAEQGRRFQASVVAAQMHWSHVPLTVSFRSAPAILEGVDAVFAPEEAAQGLTFDGAPIVHQAMRAGQAGLIELWPTIEPEPRDDADSFAPHREKRFERAPLELLAGRIAATIRGWLDDRTLLVSRNRPIQPGDVLILVPRRGAFTRAMIRALKRQGVPVAGADRMKFSEQLAVMDLLALGDFLLMSEDDLALATVLKSPLFGLDDDDLFTIGWKRRGTLWQALRAHRDKDIRYAAAADRLAEYLKRADYRPPYEFFAELLEEDQMAMRHAMIARLGADAGDALDEFLNQALAFEQDNPPSLQAFIDHVREGEREVKRDMEQGRDEVRVMTVYGAKGLEAEIVFLPDTCVMPRGRGGPTLLDLPRAGAPPNAPDHLVWVPPGHGGLEPIDAAKRRQLHGERCEYQRLLYVAMTRARDRLYVCGWETQRGREAGCWYELVSQGLKGLVSEVSDENGETVWRYESGDPSRHQESRSDYAPATPAEEFPPWATTAAPKEPQRLLPLTPSALAHIEAPGEGGDEQAVLPPDALADQSRFLRGNLIHALLQHLPGQPPALWEEMAGRYVDMRGTDLEPPARRAIVAETLDVLGNPDFAPLFGPGSIAEVPIVARIDVSDEGDPPLELAGQVDRLVALDDAVLIVDYKTNRPPPVRVESVAPAYLRQLAAYQCAIRGIFPEKRVRAALLWTDGPTLMEIPEDVLADAEQVLRAAAPS